MLFMFKRFCCDNMFLARVRARIHYYINSIIRRHHIDEFLFLKSKTPTIRYYGCVKVSLFDFKSTISSRIKNFLKIFEKTFDIFLKI